MTTQQRAMRQQIDDAILDRAAELFSRHGFAHTSIQAVADATGYSKTGLLHHYPSKDALRDAVLAQARELAQKVPGQLGHVATGPQRDRQAIEALADLAFARPGLVAFMLRAATTSAGSGQPSELDAISDSIFAAFGVDGGPVGLASTDPERLIRITGALVALAFLALAAHREEQVIAWRRHVVATSVDALGHTTTSTSES